MNINHRDPIETKTGSAKTPVVIVLSILVIVVSVMLLVRHRESKIYPRDRIKVHFECEECGYSFVLSLDDLHRKLIKNPESISSGRDVAVACPKCGEMSETTIQCPQCSEYYLPSATEAICPHCKADFQQISTKRSERSGMSR